MPNLKKIHSIQTIHEVATAMNSAQDPDGLLELILDRCIHITSAESGSLALINPETEILDIVASRGLNPKKMSEVKLKIGQGVTGVAALTAKGKIVNDVSKEPDYIQVKEGIKSEMVVPMIVEDNRVGVISMDSNRLDAFTPEMFEVVSVLANQAAQIFKNLQSIRSLEQKNKIQNTLLEISKVVNSSWDLDEVFSEIMSIMSKSLKLERGTITLYDKANGVLRIKASIGLSPEEREKVIYNPGEGITGRVFELGEPEFIEDINSEPSFLDRIGYLREFKAEKLGMSYISCPIKSEQVSIGVVSVFLLKSRVIDQNSYLDFLQVVSSIISQALRIHELFEDSKKEISRENISLKRELKNKYKFGSIIGKSKVMEKVFEKIKLISDSRASVLITGESGTGKELVANAIHYNSPRSESPFLKINCASVPANLLEIELFGQKKGFSPTALMDKKGKFELADTGNIFLEEIGELDLNLQSKILRVLEEKEIEILGSSKAKKIDVRIVASSSIDLEKLVSEKKFRADLYYKLNVVNIQTPPLRDRLEDLPLLIHHFMEVYSKENNKQIKGISREASRILSKHQWNGNVRELENVIERAVVLSQNEVLDLEDFSEISERVGDSLPQLLSESSEISSLPSIEFANENSEMKKLLVEGKAMELVIADVEAKLIQFAMKKFRYTKTRVAKFLGINRNTLDKKIKELNIEY